MTTISACIITKGEATLEAAIASVRPHVDEVVVIYTGPDDERSLAIRDSSSVDFFAIVPWGNHFAAARDTSFSAATKEYVVWLDSDDVVVGAEHLRDACRPGARIVCPYEYSLDPKTGEVEVLQARERIVPNDGTHRWVHPVHETLIRVDGQMLNDVADDRIVWRHGQEARRRRQGSQPPDPREVRGVPRARRVAVAQPRVRVSERRAAGPTPSRCSAPTSTSASGRRSGRSRA